ncbi:MAG: DNA-binding transcriptional regulator Fis [Gammaproteobacteria bacterium]|nr:DNA-binding transcriptional regulator Fis [Gammaproteobacteria bacterium]
MTDPVSNDTWQGEAHATDERRGQPLRECVRAALQRYFAQLGDHRPSGLYSMVIGEVEAPLLETVMHYARGNQTCAAEILGINRSTLRKKLKEHGLG